MSEESKIVKPRISNKLKKEIELSIAKIDGIVRHIKNVQDNCLLLGKKLIERGDIDLGKMLIAHGFEHDNSKLFGTEWDNMTKVVTEDDEGLAKEKLKLSIEHHNSTNKHHPESWPSGIKEMPMVYLAEMACDIKARSEEFGTDLRQWINETATKKYDFTEKDEVYTNLMDFVNILCEKPFEAIKV